MMMRSYFVLALLAILLAGCVNPPADEGNASTGGSTIDVAPGYNNTGQNASTQQQNQSTELPSDYTVSLGDHVWVDYTLWVQGKVLDTSNVTLANESGVFNPYRTYAPLDFDVMFNQGMIPGFVINIINMRINETVEFDVDPARGYGPYDPNKVMVVPRYYEKSLYETVPLSYFTERGLNVSNGTGFDSVYGTVFVHDFNDENVTLFYILAPGLNVTVNGMPEQVVGLNNLTATMEYMLEVNNSYVLPHPYTGAATRFKVIDKTDTNITLDSNHALANETLHFQVTLVNATRP